MKKEFLTIVLTTLMVVGATFTSAFASLDTNCSNETPISISVEKGTCISGNFVAREDGDFIGSILLRSDCTFRIVEKDDDDVITREGSYSIDGTVSRGQMADINFYVNGSFAGSARIAWPEEEGLCILLNGYIFRKE